MCDSCGRYPPSVSIHGDALCWRCYAETDPLFLASRGRRACS